MIRRVGIVLAACACIACAAPAPASAGLGSAVCGFVGRVSGAAGTACNGIGKLAGGLLGKSGGAAAAASKAAGLAAVVAWVATGARFALRETMNVLGATTSPKLTSTWFSATYWRTTAIAALLTLPFLFAAAVQALIRSDLAMLMRAAFGYLPIAILATAIAAPLTMLLLAASDEMSSIVTAAAGGTGLVTRTVEIGGALATFAKSPFLVFAVGLLGVAGALVLWLELVVREAAVYVIVLMLPLAFAAMVWPARRVWAVRGIEMLIALILSKFAIVAVLTLGSAAFSQVAHLGIVAALAGVALLMLGACAPWATLRLLPLSELASHAMAPISGHARGYATEGGRGFANTVAAHAWDENGIGWLRRLTAHMRSDETAASSPADTGDNHTLPPPGEAAPAHEAAEPPPAAVDSAPGVAEPASQAAEPAPEVAPSSRPPAPAGNGAAPPRSKWLFPAGLPDLTLSPEAVPDWPDGREHPLPDPQDPEDERL